MTRVELSYEVDDDDALERLRALTDYWRAKHGVPSEWSGSTVRLEGKKLGVRYRAEVEIGGGAVRVEYDAGFLAEKLGARGYVERKVRDYLDPAKELAELRARIPAQR